MKNPHFSTFLTNASKVTKNKNLTKPKFGDIGYIILYIFP